MMDPSSVDISILFESTAGVVAILGLLAGYSFIFMLMTRSRNRDESSSNNNLGWSSTDSDFDSPEETDRTNGIKISLLVIGVIVIVSFLVGLMMVM